MYFGHDMAADRGSRIGLKDKTLEENMQHQLLYQPSSGYYDAELLFDAFANMALQV